MNDEVKNKAAIKAATIELEEAFEKFVHAVASASPTPSKIMAAVAQTMNTLLHRFFVAMDDTIAEMEAKKAEQK